MIRKTRKQEWNAPAILTVSKRCHLLPYDELLLSSEIRKCWPGCRTTALRSRHFKKQLHSRALDDARRRLPSQSNIRLSEQLSELFSPSMHTIFEFDQCCFPQRHSVWQAHSLLMWRAGCRCSRKLDPFRWSTVIQLTHLTLYTVCVCVGACDGAERLLWLSSKDACFHFPLW